MNFNEILGRAWRFTWGNKSLWLLGFLAGLGGNGLSVIGVFLFRLNNPFANFHPDTFFQSIDNSLLFLQQSSQGWIRIALFSALLLLTITVLWVLNLIGEGGLIRAVERDYWGKPVGLGQAWVDGLVLLKRYVGVDTLIYLPLFGLTIAGMLVLLGITALFTYGVTAGWEIMLVLQRMALGLLCLIPVMVLALPVSFLTGVARRLALRTVGLGNWGARKGVWVMWQECRQNTSSLIIMIILFVGVQTLARVGISLLLTPFSLPEWTTLWQTGSLPVEPTTLQWLSRLLGDLIQIGLHSILFVYISACWTLAYRDWSRLKKRQ